MLAVNERKVRRCCFTGARGMASGGSGFGMPAIAPESFGFIQGAVCAQNGCIQIIVILDEGVPHAEGQLADLRAMRAAFCLQTQAQAFEYLRQLGCLDRRQYKQEFLSAEAAKIVVAA